jgi:hypothetical protein
VLLKAQHKLYISTERSEWRNNSFILDSVSLRSNNKYP